MCAELLYRHGRTYFCAATLMDPECFLRTAACYALFRVADDLVDNYGPPPPPPEPHIEMM